MGHFLVESMLMDKVSRVVGGEEMGFVRCSHGTSEAKTGEDGDQDVA